MDSFTAFNLKETLVNGLAKDQITTPTDIQNEAIPHILENKDLIGEAVTGSGKTLAYLLPAFQRIDTTSKELHTLILAPTHELVVQINNVIKSLSDNSDYGLRSTTIIGKVKIKRQVDALKLKPHIIVGTPGRVHELIKMKKLKAHQIKTIVIDEGDKMLADSNIDAVKAIIKTTLRDRQLLVFSASISDSVQKRASEMMKEPLAIRIDKAKPNTDITHLYTTATRRDKTGLLRKIIHATKLQKAIVFVNRNNMVADTCDRLNYHGTDAVAIYGDSTKQERQTAMNMLRTGKAKVLVASDLVARGLDIDDLDYVLNLDLPEDFNEYTHRAGRTGRAGNKGTSFSILTEKEASFVGTIAKRNGISFQKVQVTGGEILPFDTEENK